MYVCTRVTKRSVVRQLLYSRLFPTHRADFVVLAASASARQVAAAATVALHSVLK